MEHKVCTKCLIDKNLNEFSVEKKHKDGYSYYCKLCRQEYKKLNKEKIKEQNKLYFQKNKKIKLIKRRIYIDKNREIINNYRRNYRVNVLLKNNLFICTQTIRDSIRNAIKNKGFIKTSKTIDILGCSFQQFKTHIESQFEPWMNWDNKGNPKDGIYELNKTWDIDHIIPLATATCENDIIRLNHYTNLQPLCSYVNRFVKKDSISF